MRDDFPVSVQPSPRHYLAGRGSRVGSISNCFSFLVERAVASVMLAWCAFWLPAAPLVGATVLSEDFASNPAQRGWRVFGDASLFHWNSTNQNVEITWDSSHTNSFFYLPLGTVLTKSEDFSFSFDLRLSDIRIGSTPGKSNEFEIALGLLNFHTATNSRAFRGAGVSSTYGVRNIIEFDYFPDAGFGDTFATTVISTNNVFAYAHNSPLTLSVGDTFRITMNYTAKGQILRSSALKNDAAFGSMADVMLAGKPDFRVDSFAITSYSDAIQTGPTAFYGSVLAHGSVDNVKLVVPAPPLSDLQLARTNAVWAAIFTSLTNWVYTLEASRNLGGWEAVSPPVEGSGGRLRLIDTNLSTMKMFYRVRAERP